MTTGTTTIGFIGSGSIGGTVARLAVAAGHDVLVSNSRGPESLTGLVAELGQRGRAGTAKQAAQEGDLVVVSVPLKAYPHLPAAALAGKVVIDTGNYNAGRDGEIPELLDGTLTPGQLLQSRIPEARVVRVFNNVYFRALGVLSRPGKAADRSALPIAGDDAAAKETVVGFLDRIGYDAVDAGLLSEAWRFERDTPAYAVPYAGPGGLGSLDDIRPAGAVEIGARLSEAVR